MPNFGALTEDPSFTMLLSDDESRATWTYSGYFTNGTTVRWGFAEDYTTPSEPLDPAFLPGLMTKAYNDAFPPPP